jgi:hypothetical protein
MTEPEHTHETSQQPPQSPPPEVQREREIIVTPSGVRRSGSSTGVVVIFALVALAIIAFLAFTFFERDGGTMIPDEIDINVVVPGTGSGS